MLGRHNKKKMDRPYLVFLFMSVFIFFIISRLFFLQVINRDEYVVKAQNQYHIKAIESAKRGDIYFSMNSEDQKYPIATSKIYYQLYAVPRDIIDPEKVSQDLANILSLDKDVIFNRLSKPNDLYEPIKNKISEEDAQKIKNLNIEGLNFVKENFRYYPENDLASQILGFVSYKDNTSMGNYGLEGYWDDVLRGVEAEMNYEKDAYGNLITIGDRDIKQVINGSDLYLTIDQAIESFVCAELKVGVEEYGAKSGSAIVVDPQNGDILAICNYPSYDPNHFFDVKDANVYNNNAIFTAYEPGSVYKPITMAMGLDLGLVEPSTTYTDTGKLLVDGYTIQNSDYKSNGVQTMVNVLEKSLNTGAAFVAEKVGRERFLDYSKKFGFSKETGIELKTESKGDLRNLNKKGKIYLTTASFGQGITATPIQLVMAYSSLTNGGYLYKPRIVKKIVNPDGKSIDMAPQVVSRVISEKTSKEISAMLISVIENGHTKSAQSKRYYVGGKTGTAQATDYGLKGYVEGKTNQTFIGFGPSRNPKFVILTKFESPQREWAESTAGRLFVKISEFLFDYYKLQPEK